eukprot:2262050-Alexandrium_andersonii.AAC.1
MGSDADLVGRSTRTQSEAGKDPRGMQCDQGWVQRQNQNRLAFIVPRYSDTASKRPRWRASGAEQNWGGDIVFQGRPMRP